MTSNNQLQKKNAFESPKKNGFQGIVKKLSGFFSATNGSAPKEEIDYYHQYIYSHKVERILKKKRYNN